MESNKLRILIYSDHFFPSIGGSENYALNLATELSNKGHRVGVITSSRAEGDDNFPFEVYRLIKPLSIKGLNLNFLQVPSIVHEFKPDVFHISFHTGGENLLIMILRLMRVPVVLTYHGDHVILIVRILDEMQIMSTFHIVDRILVQTRRAREKFIAKGLKSSKVVLLRFNGIDTSKYKCAGLRLPNTGTTRVVCIARLDISHKMKGIGQLIWMVDQERHLFFDNSISLSLIGDGDQKKEYEHSVRELGLTNVDFLGDLSDVDLIEELCKSHFLILPSIHIAESFGRVALEAISCGIPVAVSKFAGISEIVEEYESGFVFNPLSDTGVFGRILSITNDDVKKTAIIGNGHRPRHNHSPCSTTK